MSNFDGAYMLRDKVGRRYVFNDQLELVSLLMIFIREVIYKRDTYSKVTVDSRGRQKSHVTSLGKHLSRLSSYAYLFSRQHTFHPALRFFFEEYRIHDIKYCADCNGDELDRHGRLVADIFDDFVTVMRNKSVLMKLRKKISDWDSKIDKNRKRIIEFEEKLFQRRSRLCVIRLDLEYKKAMFELEELDAFHRDAVLEKQEDERWYWEGKDLSEPEPRPVRVDFEEVQADRVRLFANMKGKPTLFKDLVGYIWRIECTPHAGYHIHLALFFAGSHLEKHAWRAQEIGSYWENDITGGRGRFHNCNMDWDSKSPWYALGQVESHEDAKREKLRERVLSYLAKKSQPVLILPKAGCHLFGSGFAHRDRSKGRGRPRIRREAKASTKGGGAG